MYSNKLNGRLVSVQALCLVLSISFAGSVYADDQVVVNKKQKEDKGFMQWIPEDTIFKNCYATK